MPTCQLSRIAANLCFLAHQVTQLPENARVSKLFLDDSSANAERGMWISGHSERDVDPVRSFVIVSSEKHPSTRRTLLDSCSEISRTGACNRRGYSWQTYSSLSSSGVFP